MSEIISAMSVVFPTITEIIFSFVMILFVVFTTNFFICIAARNIAKNYVLPERDDPYFWRKIETTIRNANVSVLFSYTLISTFFSASILVILYSTHWLFFAYVFASGIPYAYGFQPDESRLFGIMVVAILCFLFVVATFETIDKIIINRAIKQNPALTEKYAFFESYFYK
jgi:hypothetical protein